MIETNQQSIVSAKKDRSFWVICVFFLASRLLLLNYNQAEFTDGYAYINWSFRVSWNSIFIISKHLPAYPLLIKIPAMFLDPVISGRLISALAGSFCLFPLYALGLEIYGRRAAIFACILFTVSAQILFLTTRVLSEPLFLIFSLVAIEKTFRFFSNQNTDALPWLILFSGLAALTRPEGLVFIPLWLFAMFQALRWRTMKPVFRSIPPVLLWLIALWMIHRTGSSYGSEMLNSFRTLTSWRFLTHFWAFIKIYPYLVFYPLFIFAVYNQLRGLTKERKIWLALVAYVHLSILTIFSIHWAWTSRFLTLPMSLLLIEAGAGMDRFQDQMSKWMSRVLTTACVFGSIVFALVTLYYQKDTFADIKQSAQYIRFHFPGSRVFSNDAFKDSFYSHRVIEPYNSEQQYRRGDVIALHSFYGDLEKQAELLTTRYQIEDVFRSDSILIPLLANTIVSKGSNTPRVASQRFQTQKFTSIVLRIVAPYPKGRTNPG